MDSSGDQMAEGRAVGVKNLENVDLVSHLEERLESFDVIFYGMLWNI